MPRWPSVTFRRLSATGLFLAAIAIGVYVARPLRTASIGYDSQVSVIDFARLIAGRHVEQFLSTTPKPLLTFVFGPLELLSHDWRSLAWATVIAFAIGVVLSAELARRIGGMLAWAFVGVALVGSTALLFDVGYALAMPWAVLGWAVAGLAITSPRPRYGLAGIALMIATLARLETIIVVVVATAVLVSLQFGPIRRAAETRGISRPPRRAWLVLIGFGALPVMGLHDLLIYGDPLFWSTVAARYSAVTSRPILRVPGLIRWLAERYLSLWPLVALGLIGVVRLARIRSWAILIGLAALGPGMAAFLVMLAYRRISVPDRYVAPIDLSLILAAGMGTAWLVGSGLARFRPGREAPGPGVRSAGLQALEAAAAIALAVVASWPTGVLSPSLAGSIHMSLALAADIDQMVPVLRGIVDRTPGARAGPVAPGTSGAPGAQALLLVPLPYRPRLSIDLDLALTNLGNVRIGVGSADSPPAVGQFVAYDVHDEIPSPARKPYETLVPRLLNGVLIVPIASDPRRGWWISQIQTPP